MNPLIPLAILGFLIVRNKKKTTTEPSVSYGEEEEFNAMIRDLASKTTTPTTQVAPLATVMDLHVSGAEKFAISLGAYGGEDGLRSKAYQLALDMQKKVPGSCPGAPVMLGKPIQSMQSIDGGYRIVTKWSAQWKSTTAGPIRPEVKECILNLLKQTEIGERIVAFTAKRL